MQREVERCERLLDSFNLNVPGENDGRQRNAPRVEVGRARAQGENQPNVRPPVVLEERRLERVTLRPGETKDIARICITAPQIAEHGGHLAWAHMVTVHEGSARFELTTRYGDTTRRDIIKMSGGVQERDGHTNAMLEEGRAHSIVKPIPCGRNSLSTEDGPAWLVLTLDNKHAEGVFSNGPDAVFDIYSDAVPAFSRGEQGTREEQARIQWLRTIMAEGMADKLASLFVDLGTLSEEERNTYIAAMSQDDVLSQLVRELESEEVRNRYGDIGARNGMQAGAVAGLFSGAAVIGTASFLFSFPLAAPLATGAVVAVAGGAVLGDRVGRQAGKLCDTEEEAASEGWQQGRQIVTLVGIAGLIAVTSAYYMRFLLEKFVTLMRRILPTLRDQVWNLIRRMKQMWTSISKSQRKEALKAIKKMFETALARANLPGGYAGLMVTLSMIFIGIQEDSNAEKVSSSNASRS